MISKETFEAVCNNAKIHLEYGGSDYKEINRFMDDIISQIESIELNSSVKMPDMELVNTYREDIPAPSLSRALVLSTTAFNRAGCVSIPVSLREEA
jgi:Asp-tRNA(Asn)/Glu-tRNA(Gln) amidotransferase C subunit